ncbi:unnamed protein product [Blepharisma stoltei]|uniref:Uncharacterized protein n=1 Tax=Blepharisma stoltei TaxID=1481888 RepID=A0AAU9I9U2_9CILI|nr:unnamed protein product [Blepharisma stoltei]
MQDITFWVRLSQSLGYQAKESLDSSLKFIENIELYMNDTTERIKELETKDTFSLSDFETFNEHIILLWKTLNRKRREILIPAVEFCMRRIKDWIRFLDKENFKLSKKIKELRLTTIKEIVKKIDEESSSIKYSDEEEIFSELYNLAEKSIDVYELILTEKHEKSKLIKTGDRSLSDITMLHQNLI